MYARPDLCLVCECPVVDTGVRVAELDMKKLGHWWVQQERLLRIEMDHIADLFKSQICQFCLWDARSNYETAEDVDMLDWWMGHDTNKFYREFYYYESVINPCTVKIGPLPPPEPDKSFFEPMMEVNASSFIKEEEEVVEIVIVKKEEDQEAPESPKVLSLEEPGHPPNTSVDGIEMDGRADDGDLQDEIPFYITPIVVYDNAVEHNETRPEVVPQSRPACPKRYWPSIKCVHCGEIFHTKVTAYRHVTTAHADIETFACSRCFGHFKSKDELVKHVASYHPKYRCHTCKKKESKLADLWDHISQVHPSRDAEPNSVRCCGRDLKNTKDLLEHMAAHYAKYVNCVYCQASLKHRFITAHVNSFHRSQEIKCHYRQCGKYFLTLEEKQHHVLSVHERSVSLVQCLFCPCKYNVNFMQCHVTKQHAAEAVWCPVASCKAHFTSQAEQQRHVAAVHPFYSFVGNPESPKRVSDHVQKLRKPRNTDGPEGPYRCGECTFATLYRSNLRFHVASQHGTENIQCPMCPKVFKSMLSLKRHEKVHRLGFFCAHCRKFYKKSPTHLLPSECRWCAAMLPCQNLSQLHDEQICCTKKMNALWPNMGILG